MILKPSLRNFFQNIICQAKFLKVGSLIGAERRWVQFAKTVLNAIRITDSQHGDIAKRIRTVIQAFEGLEDSIVQQLCQVSCRDKEESRVTMDIDSAIQLGVFGYINLRKH